MLTDCRYYNRIVKNHIDFLLSKGTFWGSVLPYIGYISEERDNTIRKDIKVYVCFGYKVYILYYIKDGVERGFMFG